MAHNHLNTLFLTIILPLGRIVLKPLKSCPSRVRRHPARRLSAEAHWPSQGTQAAKVLPLTGSAGTPHVTRRTTGAHWPPQSTLAHRARWPTEHAGSQGTLAH